MTPEQKIIAIAEFEGWEKRRSRIPNHSYVYVHRDDKRDSPREVMPEYLPPYLTSRDAICGAVARLDALQGAEFVSHLAKVQGWTYQHESTFSDSIFSLITATPAQLADALLLTLGKEI